MNDNETPSPRGSRTRTLVLGSLLAGTAAAVGLILISPAQASSSDKAPKDNVQTGTAQLDGKAESDTVEPGWVSVGPDGTTTSGTGTPPWATGAQAAPVDANGEGWVVVGPDGVVDQGTGPMPEKHRRSGTPITATATAQG